jgi:hypothetical protein
MNFTTNEVIDDCQGDLVRFIDKVKLKKFLW